jgi:glycerate dehydrogenase
MHILAYDAYHRDIDLPNFQWAELSDLMKQSDVVSLHCPLTPETEGMINAENLSLMKPSAIIINTSRGKLVNNKDLAEALNAGVIAGAGLDVLAVEPPEDTNPLLHAKNCIITPHIAWATKEARSRLLDLAVDNIKAFVVGRSKNVVHSS